MFKKTFKTKIATGEVLVLTREFPSLPSETELWEIHCSETGDALQGQINGLAITKLVSVKQTAMRLCTTLAAAEKSFDDSRWGEKGSPVQAPVRIPNVEFTVFQVAGMYPDALVDGFDYPTAIATDEWKAAIRKHEAAKKQKAVKS